MSARNDVGSLSRPFSSIFASLPPLSPKLTPLWATLIHTESRTGGQVCQLQTSLTSPAAKGYVFRSLPLALGQRPQYQRWCRFHHGDWVSSNPTDANRRL